ncbi:aminomethyl transferase family protein [Catenulispora pinisilvae]|uniref:aminomethyl transferase family protein n=1 Tax=Catenulispora pinisilvae TaxID=2705253 RepID=UPI001890F5FE|nr:aminomethyl transferase family protein [Catenulispora pinisilvae]
MAFVSLEDEINRAGGALRMLRSTHAGAHPFPIPPQFTTWQDEQKSWQQTAVLFEMRHMTDVYFEGPDVRRLLSDVAVNSFATFGPMKAKQLVVANEAGQYVGDAILFGLGEAKVSLVGGTAAANWVSFQAERGGYDVAISRDENALVNKGRRLVFRYQVQGPRALDIVSAAHGAPLPRIKFFNIGAFDIAGIRVHALNHTMVGIPGQERTGLEIWGPVESGPQVLEALLAAGEQYGLRRGGAIAYSTTALESGWFGLVVPGIYAGDATEAYRRWLPAGGFEAGASLGGSFVSEDINDYVPTPYELGYANIVKFDHDFIGADALRRSKKEPHRRKVWLRWNREDVTRLLGDSLYGPEQDRPRYLQIPYAVYATYQYDAIMHGGRVVGISNRTGYTVNVGAWSSLCMIDEELAVDGTEVTVLWGDPQGPSLRPTVETAHALREIRAVVSTRPLA